MRYAINALGLRDASEHPTPAERLRLLLLGDSFTFGYANDYADIWPVRLEQELAAQGLSTDCVKAGVLGYDTRVEALYLPEALAAYRPDVVLLVLLPNDLVTNRPLDAPPEVLRAPAVIRPQDKPVALHLPMLLSRHLMQSDTAYALLYRWTAREQLFRRDKPALAACWPAARRSC